MNTRTMLSSVVLVASLGLASVASAAGTVKLIPAEFGRDGVPSVTAVSGGVTSAARVQAFGRDVPDARALSVRAKQAVQGDASPFMNLPGRA